MSLRERLNVTEHTDALIGNARSLIENTGDIRRAVLDLDLAVLELSKVRDAIPVVISLVIPQGDQSLSLAGVNTVQLTAVFTAHDRVGEYQDPVIWSSADDSIATVGAGGLVTGVLAGTVVVTATAVSEPSFSDSVTITVTA